jgi:hypothetical protein
MVPLLYIGHLKLAVEIIIGNGNFQLFSYSPNMMNQLKTSHTTKLVI